VELIRNINDGLRASAEYGMKWKKYLQMGVFPPGQNVAHRSFLKSISANVLKTDEVDVDASTSPDAASGRQACPACCSGLCRLLEVVESP
jgi:hypothetical protein